MSYVCISFTISSQTRRHNSITTAMFLYCEYVVLVRRSLLEERDAAEDRELRDSQLPPPEVQAPLPGNLSLHTAPHPHKNT